jgi:hypothetical protein
MFSHICNMFQMFQLFQYYVAVSVFSCCNCFYLDVAYISHTCCKCMSQMFHCSKCMLQSSVSCCKCRPPALVSIRTSRAKPRPPTRGGGASRRRLCGEEAQAMRCYCGRGGGKSFGRPGRDGHRDGVEEAGSSHPSSVGSRSEAGGFECERGKRSWCERHVNPSGRGGAAVDVWTSSAAVMSMFKTEISCGAGKRNALKIGSTESISLFVWNLDAVK